MPAKVLVERLGLFAHFSKRGARPQRRVRPAFSSHWQSPPRAHLAQPPRLRAIVAPKITGGTAMAGLELSYVYGASDRPLIGKTVGQFFDEASAKWAARPALTVRQ